LAHAKEVAEDWYLELKGKQRAGTLRDGHRFRMAADQFEREYRTITQGHRSETYLKGVFRRLHADLLPYFGDMPLSEITAGTVQEYRVHRIEQSKQKNPSKEVPLARNTLHQEIIVLRHVLRTAQRHQWLTVLPDLSPPYKMSGKFEHRAWFSAEEYRRLYEATRRRAQNPPNPRWKWECEQLHDYVLFMANTGLRPDEASRLEYRDVEIVDDEDTGETILEIEVRGKRGVGNCKSMNGAVMPFSRLKERNNPQLTDRIFPKHHRELFNAVLQEEGLKKDRDGRPRTAYSLRHTYICLRLMERADVYQIAKNCRTSVEMIEKFYASHIKNTLDAGAINVRKPKRRKRGSVRTSTFNRRKRGRVGVQRRGRPKRQEVIG
jgi:integrase